MNTTATSPQSTHDYSSSGSRPLRRATRDRMLTGVAAGVADYLRLDVTVVRIILAVLVIAVGAGIPLYVAAWLLIPAEGSDQSIAGEFIGAHRPRSL